MQCARQFIWTRITCSLTPPTNALSFAHLSILKICHFHVVYKGQTLFYMQCGFIQSVKPFHHIHTNFLLFLSKNDSFTRSAPNFWISNLLNKLNVTNSLCCILCVMSALVTRLSTDCCVSLCFYIDKWFIYLHFVELSVFAYFSYIKDKIYKRNEVRFAILKQYNMWIYK